MSFLPGTSGLGGFLPGVGGNVGGGEAPGPTPAEQLASLFANSELGGAWLPRVAGTLWQETDGTDPAGVSDFVRRVDDISGNGNHLLAGTSSARFSVVSDGGRIVLAGDGIDDAMETAASFTCGPATPWTHITAFRVTGDTGPSAARIVGGIFSAATSAWLLQVRSQPGTYSESSFFRIAAGTAANVGISNHVVDQYLPHIYERRIGDGNHAFISDNPNGTSTQSTSTAAVSGSLAGPFRLESQFYTYHWGGGLLIDRFLTPEETTMAKAILANAIGL